MGDQGTGIRVRLCSEKSPRPWGLSPSQRCLCHIRTEPSQQGVQPGSCLLPRRALGWIRAAGSTGGAVCICVQVTHPCRGIGAARNTGSKESPTWEPGAPRGPGGPGRAWGTRAPSVTQPWLSPLPIELQPWQQLPTAKLPHFPIPSPAHRTCLLLSRGWGCPEQQQTVLILTFAPAFPGNPGGP